MLRPERMSKVSVTGAKRVMSDVIEAVHDLHLVHLSDYDGSWQGFDNGAPIEGSDEAAAKLVTVRALESTLDLSADDAGPTEVGENWEERLEEVRISVNELDDRRGELQEELRLVEERIDGVEPFVDLGIDLDLLRDYDSVDVFVASGDIDGIESALENGEGIRAYETFTGDDVIAVVAAPEDPDDEGVIEDALVGLEFTKFEVPETSKSPTTYLDELRHRKRQLEADIEDVQRDLDRVKLDEAGFLLRVEEMLTVEVQQTEAPLQFATTERSFVAEGWIPTAQYGTFVHAIRDAVGDHVDIEEIEQAAFDDIEHDEEHHHEEEDDVDTIEHDEEEGTPAKQPITADGGDEMVTMDDDPPVVLDNLKPAKPFEMMVRMVSQPKYSELDPTLIVFLTFPFAFGFMIGDIGYGILYMLMGYALYRFDSEGMKAIGTIAIWAGVFTILFGYLYDDIFGVHMQDLGLALPLAGTLDKGLQLEQWALLWIVGSILFGLVHLNIGLILGFVNELRHGLKAAILEKGSWILSMNGLFIWILSLHLVDEKPAFVVGEESVLYEFLGFAGLPEVVGLFGLAICLIGFVMVGVGEGVAGAAEFPAWAFGHALSYLRMVAVLLAKGGMAFVVNLLVFGGYTDPATDYTAFNLPGYSVAGYEQDFVGLIHMDPLWVTLPIAVLVFALGHVLVLLLGITAAGIQMLRLEYVEFFQKFYEGGGEEYEPFGHERTYRVE